MTEDTDMDPAARDIMAGEYALGVLEGEELAVAQRLFLAEREFAEAVRWWRYRLSCMSEEAGEFEPSADVWPAIERLLDGRGGGGGIATPQPLKKTVATGLPGWSLGVGMAGAAAVAAVLTLVIVQPAGGPPQAPVETAAPVTGERLIAQLQSEDGALALSGYVDRQSGQIALNAAGFEPGAGQATELWVVPAGGTPQSLGLIPASGTFNRELTPAERAALVDGASLAVTYENAADAPHEAPTTDILLIGGLTSV